MQRKNDGPMPGCPTFGSAQLAGEVENLDVSGAQKGPQKLCNGRQKVLLYIARNPRLRNSFISEAVGNVK